jgi:hypothetical protein
MRVKAQSGDARTSRTNTCLNPEGQTMVRYFYAWIPVVAVGALVILSLPWLGLIALIVVVPVVLGALAAFAWAIVSVPYRFSRAVSNHWHGAYAHPHAHPAGLTSDYRTPQLVRSTAATATGTLHGSRDAA